MEKSLYVVKFRQIEENKEGLVELKLYKNSAIEVLTYLQYEMEISDKIIESIEEM